MRLLTLVAIAGACTCMQDAMGQAVSFTGTNYTQNFDTGATQALSATIGSNVPLTSLNGWHAVKRAGTSAAAMPFTTGTGGGGSGGLFLLGPVGELALGALSSGSNVPGFGVIISNDSAAPLTSFTITFDGEQWRSSTSVANRLAFAYGTSDDGVTEADFLSNNLLMVANTGGDIVGGDPVTTNGAIDPPTVTPVSLTISGVNIAVGEKIFLRWTDVNDAGNDATLAIDNFVFSTGGGGGPAAIIKSVAVSPSELQTVPGNIIYTFSGVTNTGAVDAAPATITATFPAGVSYNAGASALPPGATATFLAQVLTIDLGTVAAGGSVPTFTVAMTTSAEFPSGSPLTAAFASSPGTDVDNTSIVAFNNTNSVQTNDIVHGLSASSAANTLRLVRDSAGPGLVPESWFQPFAQVVEFDNKGGKKGNPQGNLLAADFGLAATGAKIYAMPTQALGTGLVTTLGTFTGPNTFTHGVTTSNIPLARLGGLSVSPCNDKIAMMAYETGTLYIFDYANTGDGLGSISNGRNFNDGINNSRPANTVGTTWLDNTHVMVAATSLNGLQMQVYSVTPEAITFISATQVAGDFSYTDIEYNPGVPAPLNNKVIVAASNLITTPPPSVTVNKIFVFDAPTSPDFTFNLPVHTADYSTSMQTSREISLDSAGNLYLGQFGGAATANITIIEKIAFNADIPTMFTDNNSTDYFSGPVLASSFNGIDVASNTTLPACPIIGNGGCQPADIADDTGAPLPSAGSNTGVNEGDYNAFFAGFFEALAYCDQWDDAGNPLPSDQPNTGVNEGDYNGFFATFFNGCP